MKPGAGTDKRFPLQSCPANHLQRAFQTLVRSAGAAPKPIELAKIMPLSCRQPVDRRLYPVPSKAVTNRFGGCQMKRRGRVEFTDYTNTNAPHTSPITN